ncbi:MAG: hypothetical protein ABJC12_11670, partial [Saprospiraceae bacterium]
MKNFLKLLLFSSLCFSIGWCSQNLQAQTQAWIYADSMMQTPTGEALYDSYMALSSDFTDSIDIAAGAYLSTMTEFMSDWYQVNQPIDCSPDLTFSDSTCYNYHWGLSDQTDTILLGWDLFDGVRRRIYDCSVENFSYIPLPEGARPTLAENSSPGYRFNLNPNDNSPVSTLFSPGREFSNYHSVELYIDEPDVIIPQLISSTPPSGSPSIRLNNEHVQFHVSKMSREFRVEESNHTYYFSYAFVMDGVSAEIDPLHPLQTDPPV